MSLLSMQEIAREIDAILRQRARTLEEFGLTVEREAMGRHPSAHWINGPKLTVCLETRYSLKRGLAEKYLRRLREAPSDFELDEQHRESV